MKKAQEARVEAVRGGAPRKRRSVRTLAAFGQNPGCGLATLAFTAEVDLDSYLQGTPLSAPFGQSPFAITRGLTFEANVKANDYALLRTLLEERLAFPTVATMKNLRELHEKSSAGMATRAEETRQIVEAHVRGLASAPNLIDGGVLTAEILGQRWYFEADALAARTGDQLRVGEMKSFPVVDGRTEPDKLGSALDQAATYILLLEAIVEACGGDPSSLVSREAMIITPKNLALNPVLSLQSVRSRVERSRRLLASAPRALDVLDTPSASHSFDPRTPVEREQAATVAAKASSKGATAKAESAAWQAVPVKRRVAQLDILREEVGNAYAPGCLSSCGLARYCRAHAQATSSPCLLGSAVERTLPGVGSLDRAVALADGAKAKPAEKAAARVLAFANDLMHDVGGVGP